ncbi:MAG: flagellar basal body P-ring formation protein FlgA [candidate division Zixibacteria bacterium]|nr:flagellar basal body P-ring formation protein FlgA [candidate division Zixibacteria bacterium]
MSRLLLLILMLFAANPSYALDKSILDNTVQQFFNKQLPVTSNKLEVVLSNYPSNMLELPNNVKLYINGDIPPNLRKRIPLKVIAFTEDNREVSSYVTAVVTLKRNVICSRALIKKGDILSSENCEFMEVDITEFRGEATADTGQITGMRAAKSFNYGEIIDLNRIEPVPAVLRGERVKIIADMGSLKVSADGYSREDGSIGDLIRVRNIASGKTISGKVIDKGIVEAASLR